MRRGSNDMQVNVSGIRRNIRNFVHNYSDAQKKVREATSNDPWGPSSTIMAEIADLTYNVVAFSEIMQMVWKRLNDHGKNWRHVYKSLVLLEYLIKTGSEKVGQQCKENIFAIQTLKDFQYLEEGKDQGQNVREKAKQLVILLKDDDRLKNERARALKAKERFAQSASGFGSDGGSETPTSPKYPAFKDLTREIEIARPQTAGEEELQLQLALAMSREEAEQEEQKRKSDDVRLQLALSQSQQDFKTHEKVKPNHMVDLLDVNLGAEATPQLDPWGMPQASRPQQSSPWQPSTSPEATTAAIDPWAPAASKPEHWVAPATNGSAQHVSPTNGKDPWSPVSNTPSTDLDEFDLIINRNKTVSSPTISGGKNNNNSDPFELNLLGDAMLDLSGGLGSTKTPHSFLGENSGLVNLDNLITSKPTNVVPANPFSDTPPVPAPTPQRQLFNTAPPKPTINDLKQASMAQFAGPQQPLPNSFNSNSNFPPALPSTGPTNRFDNNGSPAFVGYNRPATEDPWTPVPSTGALQSSPWTKEPANPFLS